MTEPWFDAMRYAWVPGTMLGVVGGLMGTLMGTLAPQGRGRTVLTGAMWTIIVVSAVFLGSAVVALMTGQPYGVWYGLGLPGLLGLVVFSALMPVMSNAYRMAEQRKMAAKDMGP